MDAKIVHFGLFTNLLHKFSVLSPQSFLFSPGYLGQYSQFSEKDQKRKSLWKSFMKGTTSILKSTIQITCKVSPVRQNMKLDIFAKIQRALLLRYERKP